MGAGALPVLSGWILANRLLLDPGAWGSPFWHGLAWLTLGAGAVLGVHAFFVPAARRSLAFLALLGVLAVRLWLIDLASVRGESMEPALHSGDVLVIEKWSVGLHLPPLEFPFAQWGFSELEHSAFGRSPAVPVGASYPGLLPRSGWQLPTRGDIIVFDYPDGRGEGRIYVKRVVGLPGDRFEFRDGSIRIVDERGAVLLHEPAGVLPDHANPVVEPPASLKDLDTAFTYFALNGIGRSGRVPPGGLLVLGDNRPLSRDSRSLGFIPMAFVQGRVIGRF